MDNLGPKLHLPSSENPPSQIGGPQNPFYSPLHQRLFWVVLIFTAIEIPHTIIHSLAYPPNASTLSPAAIAIHFLSLISTLLYLRIPPIASKSATMTFLYNTIYLLIQLAATCLRIVSQSQYCQRVDGLCHYSQVTLFGIWNGLFFGIGPFPLPTKFLIVIANPIVTIIEVYALDQDSFYFTASSTIFCFYFILILAVIKNLSLNNEQNKASHNPMKLSILTTPRLHHQYKKAPQTSDSSPDKVSSPRLIEHSLIDQQLLIQNFFMKLAEPTIIVNKYSKIVSSNEAFDQMIHREGVVIENTDQIFKKIFITSSHSAAIKNMKTQESLNLKDAVPTSIEQLGSMTNKFETADTFNQSRFTRDKTSIAASNGISGLGAAKVPSGATTMTEILQQIFFQIRILHSDSLNNNWQHEGIFQGTNKSPVSILIKMNRIQESGRDFIVIRFAESRKEETPQALNQIKEMLGLTAHELRTPLNGALNFIEMALESADATDTLKTKYLLPAHNTGSIMLYLINDLVDYSQLTAGKLRLVFQPTNISTLIKNICGILSFQASKKGLQLNQKIDPSAPIYINTDPNRLTQVILNLTNNAIKFTSKGSVTISVSQESGRSIKISVIDTGIGIQEQEQKLLFSRFGKLELGEKSILNPIGAGLGLSISYDIAQYLGPENSTGIQIDSKPGKGSTFSFLVESKLDVQAISQLGIPSRAQLGPKIGTKNNLSLTIEEEENSIDSPESPHKHIESRDLEEINIYEIRDNRTDIEDREIMFSSFVAPQIRKSLKMGDCPEFLVVDDDSFNCQAIETLLGSYGETSESCFNGHQALEIILNRIQGLQSLEDPQFYKAIFMDTNMPIMNGIQLALELHTMMISEKMPIVKLLFFTGDSNLKERLPNKLKNIEIQIKPITSSKIKKILDSLAVTTEKAQFIEKNGLSSKQVELKIEYD